MINFLASIVCVLLSATALITHDTRLAVVTLLLACLVIWSARRRIRDLSSRSDSRRGRIRDLSGR